MNPHDINYKGFRVVYEEEVGWISSLENGIPNGAVIYNSLKDALDDIDSFFDWLLSDKEIDDRQRPPHHVIRFPKPSENKQ